MPRRTISEKLTAWLELLRVPNLFTVPGDPLAGFCLASVAGQIAISWSSAPIYAVLLASLLFYCAGLLQNDYFDLEEDRQDRPFRPLPSNKVRGSTVILVASLFFATGLAIAFVIDIVTGITATALVLIITIYNHSGKRIPIVGPVLMGLCRGLNFLLGASVLGWSGIFAPVVMVSAIFLSMFIGAVTHIAAGETDRHNPGAARWGPAVVLVLWFSGLYFLAKPYVLISAWTVSLTLAILASFWPLYCGSLLVADPSPAVIQKTIGRFLRGLLLIQAAVIALAGRPGFIMIVMLLAVWPISQKAAKHFYAS